ncbi:hypothetical protein [Thermus aquaticus]|uniref:Uncharacterized protein n=1 Tax=Thermus aquaticus (strain ATCC BAA-2747 / Y51MC23) TaxID=498848 RepID=A0ABM5VQC4_THEA5|nr:hypothetical protein [Thermus aquaticus]ALJ92257.1 hypothetical protein TO73_2728 [Thermus aquaticus Y51MC23]
MDVTEIMRTAICDLYPPRQVILAVATFGVALGGILIAIGERERGIEYLTATMLGAIFAYYARPLLSLVNLAPGC